MRSLYFYLCTLNLAKQILWCYLLWYLTIVSLHFDPALRIWLTSFGISAVVGTGLILSVSNAANQRRDLWTTLRLFMMPFCVSSFSALVKDQGFVLILSPRWQDDALAFGLCTVFIALVWAAKQLGASKQVDTSVETDAGL